MLCFVMMDEYMIVMITGGLDHRESVGIYKDTLGFRSLEARQLVSPHIHPLVFAISSSHLVFANWSSPTHSPPALHQLIFTSPLHSAPTGCCSTTVFALFAPELSPHPGRGFAWRRAAGGTARPVEFAIAVARGVLIFQSWSPQEASAQPSRVSNQIDSAFGP